LVQRGGPIFEKTTVIERVDHRPQADGPRGAPEDVRRHGRRKLDVVISAVEGQRAADPVLTRRRRGAADGAVEAAEVVGGRAVVEGVVRDERVLEVEGLDLALRQRARVDVDLVDGAGERVVPVSIRPVSEHESIVRARVDRDGHRLRGRPVEVDRPR